MLVIIGLIAGFASILILTVRFNFLKNDNKKLLCTLTWLVALLVSGVSLAIDASRTYIPATWAIVGHWVSVFTGRRVSTVYDVVKEGSGTSPFFMFFIIVIIFTIYSLVFAGSVATARNMSRHAAKIPLKILSFLIWFFGCFCSGIFTVGIMPVILARKSDTPSGISRNMMIFMIISSILALIMFFRRLMPQIL